MENNSLFFSLRWKLAILFGGFFLILLSAFSYFFYLNAKTDFEKDRIHFKINRDNIIQTLTKDSFSTLEQFAELVSIINTPEQNSDTYFKEVVSNVDDKWSRWQLTWDIENIVFFDKSGKFIRFWGQSPQIYLLK